MLISMVIFGFGLMITFIVGVGVVNAEDLRSRQRAKDFQLDTSAASSVSSSKMKTKNISTKTHQAAA